MKAEIKLALTMGLLGGVVVFLFGGWSVTVLGILMGVFMGLSIGSRGNKEDGPRKLALQSLSTAGIAAVVFIAVSLFQNYVVAPAAGQTPNGLNIVIPANLIGGLGMILFTALTAALHGLPDRQERLGKLILMAVLVIVFPFIDRITGLRWSGEIIFALIFVILGLGLNIVVGFAGLLDMGYAAFFAIGAYTTGILSSPLHGIFINFWLVIWIALGMAALWGLILGTPTLRLRGDYLAIVTLGLGEMMPVIFRNLTNVTIKEPFTCWIIPGIMRLFNSSVSTHCITIIDNLDLTAGEKGINPIGRPYLPFIGDFQSNNPIPWYFLIIVLILLSVFLIRRLRDGRLGRAWMALREDQDAAVQMGIDPVHTKLTAFAMGAAFSGFAGAFYAAYIRGIFPSVFEFSTSIIVLCIVVLGGMGNINGVILGGIIIMGADRLFLPALKDLLTGLMNQTILPSLASNHTLQSIVAQNGNPILYRYLLFGLTLVIMMALRPEGIIPSAQVRAEMHTEEETSTVEQAVKN
jgi:branched-chain amino acid transport system permease protein